MADAHSNFAYSLVATAPSPATSGTSIDVTTSEGALFPAVPFNAVVCPANTLPLPTNSEIVRVTGIASDTFTIVRTQEGTSARTIVVGDSIFAAITNKTFTDIENLALTKMVVTSDTTVTPGYYGSVAGDFEIAAGINFEIGLGGVFEIR